MYYYSSTSVTFLSRYGIIEMKDVLVAYFVYILFMKNKLFIAAFVCVAVFSGAVATTPTAEASCSYNGYSNSHGKCGSSYKVKYKNEYRYTNNTVYSTEYLQQYIRQLQALLAQLQAAQSNGYNNGGYGNSDVDVTTKSAADIEDEEATLRGELDFDGEDEAIVYFRWGTSVNNLSRETTNVVVEEDEDEEAFSARITNLDEDTTYYFRAIAEDENGDRDYGAILSFRTDDDSNDDDDNGTNDEDMPVIDDLDANDISTSYVELEGSLDMNDFEDGYVFFVYGEDEDQVDDIASDYDTYSAIDEDGDNLQKIAVDSNADGEKSYWASIGGLNDDTEIFYTLCVAFEDEDGDDVIVCGDTESFTTDED